MGATQTGVRAAFATVPRAGRTLLGHQDGVTAHEKGRTTSRVTGLLKVGPTQAPAVLQYEIVAVCLAATAILCTAAQTACQNSDITHH